MGLQGASLLWARATGAYFAVAVTLGALIPANHARAEEAKPMLVVTFSTEPARRAALRSALETEQAPRLQAWRRQGLLVSYRLLFTRYADTGVWDGMEVLTFPDDAALAKWKTVERVSPGGVGPQTLPLVETVTTTPADQVRSGGTESTSIPVFLVVPYLAMVSPEDYAMYLDGYTLPQFKGWIAEGALAGYEVEISRYPAARSWNSTILLEYRDDAGLSRRAEVLAKVRSQLASNPSWKAISDTKKSVRVEGVLAVADQLAAEGFVRRP